MLIVRVKEKLSGWKNYLAEKYHQVMDIPDAPHKIAHGVALGTALDFFPIPLISIPVAYLLARSLRVNAIAAALSATFFKCAVPFFYALNYLVGGTVIGDIPAVGAGGSLSTLKQMGYPFFIGAAIDAALAWILIYFPVRRLLEVRRAKKRS
ncbi:DUF2062 domain-containing protein [Desulfofundulus salinus]|uniref:DUF2062 domain-containing protein n=1 Tax=Desulfofundulus salinus TaxID=2419843 RepID=A0A494WR19_9FIRM|nr:DUF2062 domain-containing protein [Desulfofundulus salinum]RKO65606.1 DUF2062 domain-containing protein [Desulfofundulus salinum]